MSGFGEGPFSWVPFGGFNPDIMVTLIGSGVPRDVQIVIPGMAAGQAYVVVASSATSSWPVRGGRGISDGSQLVLTDSRAPLNTLVTYQATVDGVLRTAAPITVPYPGKAVLQSLDAQLTATVKFISNGLPREPEVRSSAFSIPGRTRPVVRYDVPGVGGGTLLVDTTGDQTLALWSLLADGRPIVLRTDGDVRDFPAVEILLITRFPSNLTDARIQRGDTRRWTLEYLFIDDPDPDAVLLSSNWDDFDAVYAGLSWADFDTQWVGASWDEFDRFDWEGQA